MKNFILLFSIFLFSSCTLGRFFVWNFADVNDYKKFQNVKIESENGLNNYHYSKEILTFSENMYDKSAYESFEKFLEENKTSSFIVIQNDSILYENYFNKHNENSLVTSFSIAKSFVSALVGIAIEEKFIQSENDPITKYLTAFNSIEGFDSITISDLLDMRSGIKCKEVYHSPFAKVANLYYGININNVVSNLSIKSDSDLAFEYQSINTQLLGLIIEKATGKQLYKYLEEKIWIPLQMESDASWSIDSKKNENEKSFCCINAKTRDFAKFGTLYLHEGVWNGKQIISKSWINRTILFSEVKNNFIYQNQWWHYPIYQKLNEVEGNPFPINIQENEHDSVKFASFPSGAYYAQGYLGQYIYNNPEKNLTIVRFGKGHGKVNWIGVCASIAYNL